MVVRDFAGDDDMSLRQASNSLSVVYDGNRTVFMEAGTTEWHLCGNAGAKSMRLPVNSESLFVPDETGGERGFVGGRSVRLRRVTVGAGGVVSMGIAGGVVSPGDWMQKRAPVLWTTLQEETCGIDCVGRSEGVGEHWEVSKSVHFDGRRDVGEVATKGAIVFSLVDTTSSVVSSPAFNRIGSLFPLKDLRATWGDLG
jgi:hypothetical protein